MNIHVDTLDYTRDLEKAGLARPHAEAIASLQARVVKDLVEHELVTKDYLKSEFSQSEARLKDEIRKEVHGLRIELKQDIDTLKVQLRALQYGGTIAAFAISLVVVVSRLIK